MPNTNATQRAAWQARERELENALFTVKIVGGNNTSPVLLDATCRRPAPVTGLRVGP